MATITPPSAHPGNLGDYQRRVRSPLARLRGYIRAYVSLEGALLLVLYVALWFWVGLALDYGLFFKVTGIDWVQEWPWAVRLVLLLGIAGAILAAVSLKIVGRLLREFRDAALALVLERRFPQLLGDRLITAVELSDLRKAEAQGYSPAMVLETIHEAAQRVEQVPVEKAFDWRRLVRRGILAAVLTLGLYLLAGGLFLTLDILWRTPSGRTGFGRFNETAQIWFERNILLQNTIWPRRAQLELIGFPDRDLHIGRDSKAPPLRFRALEYVVADRQAPEGWRALTLNDLSRRPQELLGPGDPVADPPDLTSLYWTYWPQPVPFDAVALQLRKFDVRAAAAPIGGPTEASTKWEVADPAAAGGWRPLLWADLKPEKLDGLIPPKPPASGWKASNAEVGLTVDDVEEAVADAGRGKDQAAVPEEDRDADVVLHHLGRLADLHALVERVSARAALPEMSRTMRRLDVPETIYLYASGERSSLRNELHRSADNVYTGNFGEMKESVGFSAQADDYYTSRRYIELVQPPGLSDLEAAESRPAYLYYRPDAATPLESLRGRKQPFAKRNVLQAGSETSRIDVPAGSDLVLTAQADKPLREAFLKAAKNVEELHVRIDPSQVEIANGSVKIFGVDAPLRADWLPGASGELLLRPAKVGDVIRLPLGIADGGKGFRLELPDVRRDLVFDFEFTDADDVKGKRKVVVKPQDDTSPTLTEVNVEVLRKGALSEKEEPALMATRKARIPLTAKIQDDHALGDVRYRYRIMTKAAHDANAYFMVPSVALAAPGIGAGPFQAAAFLAAQDREGDPYAPPRYTQVVRESGDLMPSETVRELLGQAQEPPFRQLVRDVEVKPDDVIVTPADADHPEKTAQDNPLGWDFPLWQFMPADLDENHQPYWMDLELEATDTDADEPPGPDGKVRPHLSKSKETFSFLIVPENVLLTKIGEDQAKQYALLNQRYQSLQELTETMKQNVADLNKSTVEVKNLVSTSARSQKAKETLENSLATTVDVSKAYNRIVREEQLNVVRMETIEETENTIADPLKALIDSDFPPVLDANDRFRKALDDTSMSDKDRIDASRAAGKALNEKLDALLSDMEKVLNAMKGKGNVETLINHLEQIDAGVQQIAMTADQIKKRLEDAFFDTTPSPAPPKKP